MIPAEPLIEEIYQAMTIAYEAAAGDADNTAVLMRSSDLTLLVVDNGDHKIDANDIVVSIVGSGFIWTDATTGTVVFSPNSD